jgi:hypothetical protein
VRTRIGFVVVMAAGLAGCGGRGETFERPDFGPEQDAEVPGEALEDGLDAFDVAPDEAAGEEDAPSDAPAPGTFGAPCLTNSDCLSKVCVESAEGFVCSQICQEECPAGWYCRATTIGSDIVSVCVPVGANLCKACKLDTQCGDGLCIASTEGRSCGRDCSAAACPDGYDCEDATGSEGVTSRQCVPRSGACSCRAATAGVERPCVVESGTNVCLGIETCDPELGWVGCTARTPLPEGCNGIDDDCNGVADDDPAKPVDGQGQPLECRIEDAALGASCPCQWVCRGEQGWEKAGPAPKAEECNYLDDDCNGETDETFKDAEGRYDGTVNCGGCGNDCAAVLPFAKVVSCDVTGAAAKCLVDECIAGYVKAGPSLCVPQVANLCVPCVEDANCGASGEKCLELGGGKFCGRDCAQGSPFGTACPGGYQCEDQGEGVFQCVPESGTCDCTAANAGMQRVCFVVVDPWQCMGVETCDPAKGWVDCDAKTPVAETCDGADQNCNGFADETFPELKATCHAGLGACRREGAYVCNAAGDGVECNAVPGPEVPEACNGIDDDCDGATDEEWPDRGKGCLAGQGECRRAGALVCNAEGTALRCDAVEGVPSAEVCDGLDNDCNGDTDEDPKWADVGTVCTVGKGACAATGVVQCNAADRAGPPVCSAVEGTPATETCNGLDDNCDGFVDETWPDRGKGCLAGLGECRRAGALVCNAQGTGLVCDAVEGAPATEVCNGLDDDCNGTADEDPKWANVGKVCTAGQGVCVRAGVYQCNPADRAGPPVCSAVEGTPGIEVCDYLDNDCDGATDNGFVVGGRYALATACGNCFTDCTAIYDLPNAFGTCDAVPATPACRMGCDIGFFDLNAIPDDGCEFGLDAAAIYVSANDAAAVDDATCGSGPVGTGTGNHPCRTIAYGLGRAGTGKDKVLVADGLYQETVTLVGGKSLLGGYRADTWERHLSTTLTTIRGTGTIPSTSDRVTVIASSISVATTFEGFHVQGQVNPAAGAGSYAVYGRNSTDALTIANNFIEGGMGGPGAKGNDGANGFVGTTANGAAGSVTYGAAVACASLSPALPRAGAAGGTRTCGTSAVNGGAGGGNTCTNLGYNNAPETLENGVAGTGTSPGAGGAGGYDSEAWACSIAPDGECHAPTSGTNVGLLGAAGAAGVNGTTAGANGCQSAGQVAGGLWVATTAMDGAAGTNGSGGGGGGAGGSARNSTQFGYSCSTRTEVGATGGGGGAGGCGGAGGLGGGAGGGSFGLFLVWDSVPAGVPVVTGNTIVGGQGGNGGNGGNGGSGSPGGGGGAGGLYDYSYPANQYSKCAAPGGDGGNGGNGGHGEGGGGGCGGPSYGIFASGNGGLSLASYLSANTVTAGPASAGGSGGASIGTQGDAGAGGTAAATNF